MERLRHGGLNGDVATLMLHQDDQTGNTGHVAPCVSGRAHRPYRSAPMTTPRLTRTCPRISAWPVQRSNSGRVRPNAGPRSTLRRCLPPGEDGSYPCLNPIPSTAHKRIQGVTTTLPAPHRVAVRCSDGPWRPMGLSRRSQAQWRNSFRQERVFWGSCVHLATGGLSKQHDRQ